MAARLRAPGWYRAAIGVPIGNERSASIPEAFPSMTNCVFALVVKVVVVAACEQERLDDHGHDVGGLDHLADVHVVKLLELHAVNRHHVAGHA